MTPKVRAVVRPPLKTSLGGVEPCLQTLEGWLDHPLNPQFFFPFFFFFFVNNPLGYNGHFTWILLRNYPKIPRKILMKK